MREILVKVSLQIIVAQSVTFLVLCVALTFDLQTLIRQMCLNVLVFQVILRRACSQVAMLVEVNAEVLCDDCPHTHIELAIVEQKGMLDVFLHDPGSCLRVLIEDKVIDVPQVPKNLDASALIKRRRLHKPHVLPAVLQWDTFFS